MHNLHSYLIILIFVLQIGVSEEGNGENEGPENESIVNFNSYSDTPLKAILPNDAVDYVLPLLPSSEQSSVEEYTYLCPITDDDISEFASDLDNVGKLKWNIEKPCLKPTKIKNEDGEVCSEAFTFSITQVEENLRNVDVFIFGYDVCGEVDLAKKTVKSVPLEIYKVYVNTSTKQALHTEHRILSGKQITPPDVEIYMKELKLTHYENSLKRLPTAYINVALQPKPKSKNNLLHSILSRVSSIYKNKQKSKVKNKFKEHLIPQMLVPYTDLEPSSSRGATFNYLNIRPQYKRLRSTWHSINQIIWKNLNSRQLSERTKIYTSASNISKHHAEEVKIQVDKKFQIEVPSVWWHLIRTDDGRAIIILLHNVPLDYSLKKINLCETICSETGWNEVHNFDANLDIYVECCEASKNLLKTFGFIKSDMKIEGILNLLYYEMKSKSNKKPETERTEDEENIIDVTVPNKPLMLLKKGIADSTFDRTSFLTDVDLSSSDSIVQGCPENISGNDCIHLVPTEIAIETCSREVQPNIVASETSCADEGILYTFQYKVCYNTNGEEYEVTFDETPMLYSVCYDKNKKETIYAIHKILTDEPSSADLNANIYIKRLKTYGVQTDVQQDLQNMAITYEKYLQENIVPQMLVPSIDMDQNYAMGANFHYLNIRPQYARIADRWNKINKTILQHLLDNKMNTDVTLYTGTAPQLPYSSIRRELQLDENFSINIPMAWGKIITLGSKSIAILIYNIPFKHYLKSEQRFCKMSICAKTNWLNLEFDRKENVFNYENVHVQCCETTEHILNYFRLSHLRKEFGEKFEILRLPKKEIFEISENQNDYPRPSTKALSTNP